MAKMAVTTTAAPRIIKPNAVREQWHGKESGWREISLHPLFVCDLRSASNLKIFHTGTVTVKIFACFINKDGG